MKRTRPALRIRITRAGGGHVRIRQDRVRVAASAAPAVVLIRSGRNLESARLRDGLALGSIDAKRVMGVLLSGLWARLPARPRAIAMPLGLEAGAQEDEDPWLAVGADEDEACELEMSTYQLGHIFRLGQQSMHQHEIYAGTSESEGEEREAATTSASLSAT